MTLDMGWYSTRTRNLLEMLPQMEIEILVGSRAEALDETEIHTVIVLIVEAHKGIREKVGNEVVTMMMATVDIKIF